MSEMSINVESVCFGRPASNIWWLGLKGDSGGRGRSRESSGGGWWFRGRSREENEPGLKKRSMASQSSERERVAAQAQVPKKTLSVAAWELR